MRTPRVTEAELVDVVIGGNVESWLQDRVKQAARTDLRTAVQFARWTDVVTVVCQEMEAPRQAAHELTARVMGRIADLKQQPEQQDFVYPDEVVDAWNGIGPARWWDSRTFGRRLGKPALAACAALLALAVGITYLVLEHRYTHTFVVERAEGDIQIVESEGAAVRIPLQTGARLAFPMRLQLAKNAEASLRFPHGTAVRLSESTEALLIDSRSVRQFAGTAGYRVLAHRGLDNFTVYVPQGSIVDLGTEFEVVVADEERAVVKVESGRVQVLPRNGEAGEAGARQHVILTPQKAVTEDVEDPPAPAPKEATSADAPPDRVDLVFRPHRNALQADTPLTVFVRPQAVPMPVLTQQYSSLVKTPPFTNPAPRAGAIKTRLNEQPAEAAVACDTKLNGETWIYVDANMNGDLTDDPRFQEGADFVAGETFAVGLAEHSDALWLRRPIRVDTAASPPKASVVEDRLECVNRAYLEGELEIPGMAAGAPGIQQRFLLLDTNSDGDYGDPEGGLGVWVSESRPGEPMQVLNVASPGRPTTHMGYRWTLTRNLSGDFVMSGERVQKPERAPLRVGGALPRIEVTTTAGQRLAIEPPAKGYLLLFAWSTWYSACQRDVPFDFNDLHTKFGPRGLVMVGISTDFREEDLLDYVTRNQISYPQIYNGPDLSAGPLAELGIDRSPLAILVDATGTVVSVGDAAADIWSFLDSNLQK